MNDTRAAVRSHDAGKQSKIQSLEQELANAMSENQKIKEELNKVIEKKKKSNVKKTVRFALCLVVSYVPRMNLWPCNSSFKRRRRKRMHLANNSLHSNKIRRYDSIRM